MTVQNAPDFRPCVPGAFRGGLSRTLFFDGMVLSEEDMMREQSYWRMKRRLTNRALGHGIVWGLALDWDSQQRRFTLCPGYGLNCCGDDLVVECAETVTERQLIDPCSEDFRKLLADPLDPCGEGRRPDAPIEACLMLEYVECPEDPRRVYEDPCADGPARGCRYGAVRETTRLRIVAPPPPPPASPIERFCKQVADLRLELLAAGIPMPQGKLDGPLESEISLQYIDAAGRNEVQRGNIALTPGATIQLEHAHPLGVPGADEPFDIRIEPPELHFFSSAIVATVDRSGGETVMAIENSRNEAQFASGFTYEVDAEVAPLFWSGEPRRVRYRVVGSTGTTNMAGVAAMPVTRLQVTILSVDILPRRKDCTALLTDALFRDGDALCTLKALAIAVVHGWFAGAMGASACNEAPEVSPGREALAWMACKTAWEALYGVDIARAPEIQKCLRRLFAEWCESFHYKGPRCDHDSHGILLGSVQISPKGQILCFREWQYRRYVLTGPLLTHWASQFGVPPIDVAATRLASWICCVAGAPLPHDALAAAAAPAAPAAEAVSTESAAMPIATDTVVYAKSADAQKIIGAKTIVAKREVSTAAFVTEAIGAMFGNGQRLSASSGVEIVSTRGGALNMMRAKEGAETVQQAVAGDAVRSEIAASANTAPAMARAAILDFSAGFAEAVSLSALKPDVENRLFEPTVAALEEAGVGSIAELLRVGAEPAARSVRAMSGSGGFGDGVAIDRGVALVANAATRTLSDMAEALAAEARGRDPEEPFTRADLIDGGTLNAVRNAANAHLKGRGMSNKALRDVAAGAAARW
jgi:hypothetical protein